MMVGAATTLKENKETSVEVKNVFLIVTLYSPNEIRERFEYKQRGHARSSFVINRYL